MIDVVAPARRAPFDGQGRTWNVFRRKDAAELRCAVPEERIVPGFITDGAWEFAGRIGGGERPPDGFDARAAGQLSQWNGFYLFETWGRAPRG
ncbi:hypothetical protein [Salinarimonas sp.]|uniref:hypothetical protein n=1 Tax=Salinarimonas sp. TaxID=2766526 RepID=UPI0032D8C31C